VVDSQWKIGRAGQRYQKESEGGATIAHEAIAVGETLRRNREQQGLDLRQVAEMLRIRLPYLRAIENSLIDQLPGPAYALGFVKAYAEYLGLDSEPFVERFKDEQSGLNSKTELVFPSPLSEGKAPSGAILIVAAVMAVAAYSGWVYFSDADKRVVEVVPPLPQKAKEIAAETKVKEIAAETLTAGSTADVGNKAVAVEAPTLAAVDNLQPELAVPKASVAGTGEANAMVKAVVPSVYPGSTDKKPKIPVSSVLSAVPVMPQAAVAPTSTPLGQDQSIIVEQREPKVFGADANDSRIVLLAVGPTWVEIRDTENNEVLLTRVLYFGDRYRAPNRTGLVLMTGNAGDLQIIVDGQSVPSIGPKGSVRRNVQLDPAALRQGRAVQALIGLQQQPYAPPKPDALTP
jgi:cytoskeleton protein RodZ